MKIKWSVVRLLLLCTSLQCVLCSDQMEYAPIVQINLGKVRAIVQQSEDGHRVYQYKGIRYGHAERFAKPRPVEPWTDVYNATEWRDACPQTGLDNPLFGAKAQSPTMSEDCLFVNVWRPAEEKANRSVMFYIHGGSFGHGTIFSLLYNGRYLSSHGDVIVVTFGFLYGNTTNAPGNQALHDQILALKWVQENIHHFDASQITIFGKSAGAFTITAMILSPLTKGMFRRALLQSGAPTSLSNNAVNKPLNRTQTMATLMKCPTTHMNESLACLRNKTVNQILEMQTIAAIAGQVPVAIFGDEILPIDAVEALKEGKYNKDVDLMYGVTRDEGSIFVGSAFTELDSNQTILTVESTHKYILKMNANSPMANEIADFYTKDLHNPSQLELRSIIGRVLGDPTLMCSTILLPSWHRTIVTTRID